ncbi:hypothetical protein EJB05_06401, partial [Eragrostis curvula]
MVSGGGAAADGKKRKASVAAAGVEAPAKREPRRGMGVAELERIRVELEMAETCYAIVPSPLSAAAAAALHHLPPPAPAPPACFVGHLPGVAMTHHQYVGNGAVQVEYFTPYYRAQHYASDSLTSCRLFRSNGQHAFPHQKNLVDQIQSAVTTSHPALGQAASSESSSSAYQLQDHRRTQPPQLGQTRKVAYVDLVDSDDDDGGIVEELDLELKL